MDEDKLKEDASLFPRDNLVSLPFKRDTDKATATTTHTRNS